MATFDTRTPLYFAAWGVGVFSAAKFWLNQVTKYVPDSYLDEVFHIPQAQAYCKGDYQIWDSKITTPPGLYVFSNIALKFSIKAACSVYDLRNTNVSALLALFICAVTCRRIIESSPPSMPVSSVRKSSVYKSNPIPSHTFHTAFNIALFPPLFFFSSLYYTDILSTAVVLLTYYFFLRRGDAYNNFSGGLQIFAFGSLALTMRQTNIFWVAVFMAGLELVRTVENLGPFRPRTWTRKGGLHPYQYFYKHLRFKLEIYGRGELHDFALEDATLYDCVLCAISVAIAAVYNPILIITHLWPYFALLCSFAGFIVWNGGVVLGDKSNHIATLHLPQMLYIWPFFVFFSAPLLSPFVLNILKSSFNVLTNRKTTAKLLETNPRAKQKQQRRNSLLYQRYIASLISFSVLLAVILVVIHYNTIIHPFTLADNRHYIFYIFRYSIRSHPLIRYILAPIYLFCSWLVFRGLSGIQESSNTPVKILGDGKVSSTERQKESESNSTLTNKALETFQQFEENTTSFALIWFLSTALSLATAPLVEPRYFIIPWVVWRLHVPLATSSKSQSYLLWLETLWFLIINVVTGYVFLFRGFEWPQEPGKVQRFMW